MFSPGFGGTCARPAASRAARAPALGQVESGTSLPVIQQLLGHSSLATTAIYVSHIAPAKAVAEATSKTAHLAMEP